VYRSAFFALAAAVVAQPGLGAPAEAPTAIGFWVTPNHGAVVHIVACDSGLCGYLVGLRTDHEPGEMPRDAHNPDPALRSELLCGRAIMGSLKPAKDSPTKWEGGWVYDPASGNTYTAEMRLDGGDRLKLRGYLGISLFGRSETWQRERDTNNRCALPPAG